MAGNTGEPGRTVTSKLAAILIALANGRQYTMTELARQTNLPISTVWRLLSDLLRSSLVERTDDGSYRPGLLLRRLTHDAAPPSLRERAPFVVDDLATALHRTVRLGVFHELEVAYIEKEPGPTPGTLFPNPARLPLHATAMGKALLAFAPAPLIHLVVTGCLPRYTSRTLSCPIQLRHNLHWIRMHGYATTDRELGPAVGAVAVPVFLSGGVPIAAIEAEVLSDARESAESLLPALRLAAHCLTRELAAASPGGAARVGGTLRPSAGDPAG